MDNVCFTFGPNQSYIFNAPTTWSRRGLPKEIDDLFKENIVSEILCASFGDDPDSYFFVCETKADSKWSGNSLIVQGNMIPAALKTWLNDKDMEKVIRSDKTRVVLGPGDSFVAWDRDAIRWSGVPAKLEETLQSWLTPSGWDSGPPRLIALGHGGAYFALSEYGEYDWSMPSATAWPSGAEFFTEIDQSQVYSWTTIKYISMCPSYADRWVVVFANTWVRGGIDSKEDPQLWDDFKKTADSIASDEIKAFYKNERETAAAEEAKRKQTEEEAKKKADGEARRKAAEAAIKRRAAEEKAAQMQLLYVMWVSAYEAAFKSSTPLRSFPLIPLQACVCQEVSCVVRKKDSGLTACRHDLEQLLRASGKYSSSWLRTERNSWHPDRFGNKCDPSYRDSLKRQSQEIFTIYGELIEAAA